ncbi:hypothetical protein HHK36_000842 [Tetracentron sinense]|uniref:Uncharacterized protein n=1 Tax=Tetracentron sinense TaxID=13715 RepID=A0A834ZWK7_TETSI|nr:hypothetical protein HHK36_000842 [Tetracentron sinense]
MSKESRPWRPFTVNCCSIEDQMVFGNFSRLTQNFSNNFLLGQGGFGTVHKGYVDESLRQELNAQTIAVKLLDIEGLQGHREWLDFTDKLSDLGLAKMGPEGSETHVSTRVMGTYGYAAPKYITTVTFGQWPATPKSSSNGVSAKGRRESRAGANLKPSPIAPIFRKSSISLGMDGTVASVEKHVYILY